MNAELQAVLDPAAIAKAPTQARAKQRFEAVLREAETMLVESGLARFSIPLLAERLQMTRGSVYAYFPSHYAILNELVGRYLEELEELFLRNAQELMRLNWREGVRTVVEMAVNYHNSHPAARLLILGGAVTDASYRAQETLLQRLGQMGRQVWEQKCSPLPDSPDVFTLSVDMAVACFRRSVFESGEITPAYRDMAVEAMQGFLERFLEPSAEPV